MRLDFRNRLRPLAQIIVTFQPRMQLRGCGVSFVIQRLQYLWSRADHHMRLARRAMVKDDDVLQHARGSVTVSTVTTFCGHKLLSNSLAALSCSAQE